MASYNASQDEVTVRASYQGNYEEAIAKLLRSLATDYGKTVILVSHDPKTVEHFPTVYGMRDGQFARAA